MMIGKTSDEKYAPLFLKMDGDSIVVCDENGRMVYGLIAVAVENKCENLTMAQITFSPCGWIDKK